MSSNGKTEKPQNSLQAENNKGQSIKPDITIKLTKAEQSSEFLSSLKEKTLWDWLKLVIAPLIIAVGAAGVTVLWNNFAHNQASELEAKRYHQSLVKEYIDSVKILLLDEYHHEDFKKPEILPTDVEDFVKSKTATTLKALKESQDQRERLINFLRRVGVGFAPLKRNDYQSVTQDICAQSVTTKNKEYLHFLCAINLNNVNLNDGRLSYSILQYAKFHNATLIKANLDHSHLQYAFLKAAKLNKAFLVNVELKEANLTGANLTDANLTDANLTDANLRRTDLRKADLTKANLREANLFSIKFDSQTKLEGALFDSSTQLPFDKTTKLPFKKKKAKQKFGMLEIAPDADLIGADFSGAYLRDRDLAGADLTKADLRGAKLKRIRFDKLTTLKGALFDSSTQLPFDEERAKDKKMRKIAPGADLRGADLRDANLTGADLTKADLRGAKLSNAQVNDKTTLLKLKDALFDSTTELPLDIDKKEAKKEYGMLKIAPGADLRGADLTGANLTGVNLTGVNLTDADLTGVNLTDADLINANFTDADLTDADLTDANFTNAKITDAQLALAKLCRTIKYKDQDNEKILNKYCEFYSISSKLTFLPRQ